MSETNIAQKGKKKTKQIASSRILIIVLLLLLQVGFFVVLWEFMKEDLFYSYGLTILLTFLVYMVIVNRKGNPSYKLAWMLPIILLPVFGILLYIFLEYQKSPWKLDQKQKKIREKMTEYMKQDPAVYEELKKLSPETANLSSYLYRNMQFPVYQNTTIKYFSCGEVFFPPFLEELEKQSPLFLWNIFLLQRERCGILSLRF